MGNEEMKGLARQVLEEGYLMSLGTVDEGGVWVADVIYIHDEAFNLYWLSMPHVRHSKAIEENSKVACTITASWKTDAERALQIEGIAERIEGPMFELEKRLESKRGLPLPDEPGEILKKGHSWYMLKPTKIELLHSQSFGYDKK